MATLTAAYYSRCAAGLLEWPSLPFGTRVMVVQDPPERNSFMPRSLPATVFCPGPRVSGSYIVYQHGRLREAVNIQPTSLDAEELVYIKAHIPQWLPPEAPAEPPRTDTWNAAQVDDAHPPSLEAVPVPPAEDNLREERSEEMRSGL